jgi:hypothetical protein
MFNLDSKLAQRLLAFLALQKARRCHYQKKTMTKMKVSASSFSKQAQLLATHLHFGFFRSTNQSNQYSCLRRFEQANYPIVGESTMSHWFSCWPKVNVLSCCHKLIVFLQIKICSSKGTRFCSLNPRVATAFCGEIVLASFDNFLSVQFRALLSFFPSVGYFPILCEFVGFLPAIFVPIAT